MATFSRRAVKLVAALSTVPALGVAGGLGLGAVYAEEDAKAEGKGSKPKRIFKACELPLYKSSDETNQNLSEDVYPRNEVERQIGVARKAVWEVTSGFEDTYNSVQDTVNIGVEHTKSTLDFVQSNPGELPRVALIAVAGMGGVVLGYRGGVLRKVVYSSIAIGSCAALCYPQTTLDISQTVADEVSSLWKEIGGQDLVDQYWPFGDKEEDKASKSPVPAPEPTGAEAKPALKGDVGQSNPKDKDMYSTRSL